MNRIGVFDILEEKRLIVPDSNEDGGWIDFMNGVEMLQLHLLFKTDDSDKSSRIKIRGMDDHSEITLVNWNNVLGTCTLEPLKLGKTADDREIYVMIVSTKISSVNVVGVQLMLRSEYGKADV